jgi:hypothetical protein
MRITQAANHGQAGKNNNSTAIAQRTSAPLQLSSQ